MASCSEELHDFEGKRIILKHALLGTLDKLWVTIELNYAKYVHDTNFEPKNKILIEFIFSSFTLYLHIPSRIAIEMPQDQLCTSEEHNIKREEVGAPGDSVDFFFFLSPHDSPSREGGRMHRVSFLTMVFHDQIW